MTLHQNSQLGINIILTKIPVKNPDDYIYPVKKILDKTCTENLNISLFWTPPSPHPQCKYLTFIWNPHTTKVYRRQGLSTGLPAPRPRQNYNFVKFTKKWFLLIKITMLAFFVAKVSPLWTNKIEVIKVMNRTHVNILKKKFTKSQQL